MCRKHWYMVSRGIRMRVLHAYVPGQEKRGWSATSDEYREAVKAAIDYVAIAEGYKLDPMEGTEIV